MEVSRKNILIIEDNHEAASLVSEELMERGYAISLAYNGQEGFAAILKTRPDLVLCDISMPGMSGFEVLERLIQLAPRFEQMPFIFLTAFADRDNEIKGRSLGADDYVTKPVDFEILDSIIRARLARIARSDIWPKATNLSDREIEVLTWAARGKTLSEITEIMNLKRPTVKFHINNARAKLGVATTVQAVVKATAGKLIDPYSE